MKIDVFIVFLGSGVDIRVIKVYGNTLYFSCFGINQIMSIDLTATSPIAKTVVDASADGLDYGFCGFVINNSYIYIGCYYYAYVLCYHMSTDTRTKIDGRGMFNFMSGVGVYNNYLYISSYVDASIAKIPLSIANTDLVLTPTNTEIVYWFDPNIYADYYSIIGFEIYFNNAIIIIIITDGITSKLIHINLDNTQNLTIKTISQPFDFFLWPTVYNKYIYITCGYNADTIIRVPVDLNCFKDDTIIFANNGLGWKFEINCSQPFIKIDYVPTITN